MPGDYDIEYASPWAGANYMPYVFNLMHLLLIYPIFILSISNNASLSDILVKFLICNSY